MFDYIQEFFADPKGMLMLFLLAFPGRMLAISAHEAAHGWVAEKCGDPTARMCGRITLNPIRHLDPVGLIMMMLFGFGWAKPMPVNPRNFRSYRRDDLKVSLAGIAMNMLLFVTGILVMYAVLAAALLQFPYRTTTYAVADTFRSTIQGVSAFVVDNGWYRMSDLIVNGIAMADLIIVPAFGKVAGYLYEMLVYFIMTNLSLAIFNLIPLPPLDGYHVVNDLLLKRPLFSSRQAMGAGMAILYVAMFSGALDSVMNWAINGVFSGVGAAAIWMFTHIGIL